VAGSKMKTAVDHGCHEGKAHHWLITMVSVADTHERHSHYECVVCGAQKDVASPLDASFNPWPSRRRGTK